ncbi:hypothetical protein [Ruminococcus sp.]|uniref:hypothetical protein n=1 Tax=Ruminococcus sp. TaxID=41978 RepID=UPI00388D02AC
MAKKKKSAKPSVPEAQKSVSLDKAKADTENKEAEVGAVKTEPVEQAPMEEEITLSQDTIAEIGEPDKELVFKNVARAYEEAKRKREKYKRIGSIFVLVSGIVFLTLIFTLENKITFLIFWVITILYTVALMIRTEYKYHQFRKYLGLIDEGTGEENMEDEMVESQPEGSAETQAAEPQPEGSTEAQAPETASSKNQQEEKE